MNFCVLVRQSTHNPFKSVAFEARNVATSRHLTRAIVHNRSGQIGRFLVAWLAQVFGGFGGRGHGRLLGSSRCFSPPLSLYYTRRRPLVKWCSCTFLQNFFQIVLTA